MNTEEIIAIENKHTSGVYAKQPLAIVRGQGASLFDAEGVEYLDCSTVRHILKIQDKNSTTLRNAVNALIEIGAIVSTSVKGYGKNCSYKIDQGWYDTFILRLPPNSVVRVTIDLPHPDALEAA